MAPTGDNKVQVRITYPRTALRRHRFTSVVIFLYLCLLVIPWIITCLLSYYPFSQASYGSDYPISSNDVEDLRKGARTLAFLHGAQAVLAIPLTSFIIARAAVVLTQRKSAKAEPLTAADIFALSSRQWENAFWIKPGARFWKGKKPSFVALGTLLIILASVTPPLRGLFVVTELEQVPVRSQQSLPYLRINGAHMRPDDTWNIVGYDPDSVNFNQTRLSETLPLVTAGIQVGTGSEISPNLWVENQFNYEYYDPLSPQPASQVSILVRSNETKAFVSTLPNGTSTGIIRDYALRLGSTVNCSRVDKSAFPSPCPGEQPFTTNLTGLNVGISVCVPGNYRAQPWLPTLDRQDVVEHLYLDVQVSQALANMSSEAETSTEYFQPFTVHCQSSSTKGYFELPSSRNGYKPGPVMSQFSIADFAGYHSKGYYENNSDPVNSWESINPGPLTTASLALFGNTSFLHQALSGGSSGNGSSSSSSSSSSNTSYIDAITTVIQDTCAAETMPFGVLQIDMGNWTPPRRNYFSQAAEWCRSVGSPVRDRYELLGGAETYLYYHLRGYGDVMSANTSLSMAVFYANEALMRRAAARGFAHQTTRPVFGSAGVAVPRPRVSFAALVTLSALVVLQALLLLVLWGYILSAPVWTDELDALAAARVGARMPPSLLRGAVLGESSKVARDRLIHGLDEIDVVFAEVVAGDELMEMRGDTAAAAGGLVRRRSSSPRESLVSELTVTESLAR